MADIQKTETATDDVRLLGSRVTSSGNKPGAGSGGSFWRRRVAWPLAVFLVTRLGLLLLTHYSIMFLPVNPDPAIAAANWSRFPHAKFLEAWARWDSGWYEDIAKRGYSDAPKHGDQRNITFLPLYPLAMRAVSVVVGDSVLAGMIVSNIAFAAGLILFFALATEMYGEFTGNWSVVLLSTYPFAFYFGAVYSESVFFLTIVAAFYFGYRKHWALAAICAALASATRVVGVTVGLGLALLYLKDADFRWRNLRVNALWLLLCPMGMVAYALYLWRRFGDPLLFTKARYVEGWEQGKGLQMAWDNIHQALSLRAIFSGDYPAINIMHLAITLVGVILLVAAWRKLHVAHAVWALACIGTSFFGGWHGMGRYILPVFPVFLSLPLLIRSENKLLALAYLNTLLLALLTTVYSLWFWVS